MNSWTKENLEDLKVGYEIGVSVKEIAEIFECSISTVKRRARELGIYHFYSIETRQRTNEQYDNELKEKCPTQIRIEDYINANTSILHRCLLCEEIYLCTPKSKLQGWEHCKTRNNGNGISPNKPGITYLVHIPEYDIDNKWFIKLGVTGKTTKERFADNNLYSSKYEIILERYFDLGSDAMQLEKEWKSNIKDYLVNLDVLKNGNTETFLY